ncbi:MAG: histidine--tRNA ligase [Myxococcota bacterium]
MSQKYAGVKGMNDLLPPQIATWQRVESVARALFGCYGYQEIRTPIVEDTALFVRSVGEVTDIVKKEMYTFDDKGGRSITLRPEGTAPAARAYIEHGIANTEPVTRWYYLGPMFRYERMKTGRYRQFYQLGAEAYGSLDPSLDVEVIALMHELLRRLGVPDVVLHLNSLGDSSSRPRYVEALKAHFAPLAPSMSSDAKDTFERNPMRLLDSKEEALAAAIAQAPAIVDFLDEASKKHFDDVQRLLAKLNIPWTLDRRLVRGLDYYTRTTFEFIYEPKSGENALGTAGTVCGGGRYDGLVHELGGPEKPAVGFALGLDRLVMLLEAGKAAAVAGPTLFVGTFDGPLRDDAVAMVMKLRNAGHFVDFDPRGGKLKRQIERADKVGARFFTTWGEKEVQAGKLELKALALPDDHPQKTTTVELAGLEAWLALNATPGKAS